MFSLKEVALRLGRAVYTTVPQAVRNSEVLSLPLTSLIYQPTSGCHWLSCIVGGSRLQEPNVARRELLAPISVSLNPSCGMKLKGKLKRRCKDCYLVVRDGRAFIMCPTHGRHKQMALTPHKKKTWILTHATQGKIRPW